MAVVYHLGVVRVTVSLDDRAQSRKHFLLEELRGEVVLLGDGRDGDCALEQQHVLIG